jgi:hypothetical protein
MSKMKPIAWAVVGLVFIMSAAWLVLSPPSVTRSAVVSGRDQLEPKATLRKVISVRGDADSIASLRTYLTCQPEQLGPEAKATVKASLKVINGGDPADAFTERTMEMDAGMHGQAMLEIRTAEPAACLASGCKVEVTCQLVSGTSGAPMKWKTESRGTFRLPKLPTFSKVGWVEAVEEKR